MGGKTATSTQSVGIPASVLAQYQSVNDRATQTANTPFQQYNGQFVAPVNAQQNAGIENTNAAAGEAQPYFGAATNTLQNAQAGTTGANNAALGLTAASAQQVNAQPLTGQSINQYLSPYLQDVVGSESQLLNQNNQQQQAGQLGTAISSGAFGGDRTGLAAANLAQQQNLSNANIYSNLLNTGYNNALSTAQQQQGVNLSAGQANRAALGAAGNQLASIGQTQYGEGANTASSLAALGTGAQSAGLQGASAQLNAGTLQQQTQQAQDTAQYNQFQQQQSYPFQVDQFLANIAEGTGALSGSTTTTQQPGGFFSDERLKEDKKPIGKTYDGQTIYSYKMKGDPRTRIGLMAQDVEKSHPEAVGLAAGYKTVDYGKATDEAANKSHFYAGGVVPIRRIARADGGDTGPYDIQSALGAQQAMYGHMGGAGQNRNIPNQGSNHQLTVANGAPAPQPSGASKVNTTIGLGKDAYSGYKWATKPSAGSTTPDASGVGVAGDDPQYLDAAASSLDGSSAGVGAADAGAADAAGSGVAAAAPAAADAGASAAAGAATSAAAGAAVDAGAEEAAALAAEYAVGDVAVAALAAKRGGAIRSGLAAGGIPYEDPSAGAPYSDTGGGMNIPDTENTAKVQTAGPIKKQPTGLQTLMMMGNPDDASTIAGGMFSNTALAAGGRIHKDEGGGLDPDPDFTADPTGQSDYVQKPIEVKSSSKFSGVAPDDVRYTGGVGGLSLPSAQMPDTPAMPAVADESSSGVAPRYEASREETPPTDSGGSWFHKHAGDILPVLQGIAAMGTAPTRSWGTALAAGLGAGAGAYVPDQEGLARASLTQAQAANSQIQAALGRATNDAVIPRLNAINQPTEGPAPNGGVPSISGNSGTASDPTVPLVNRLRQQYANPPVTPDEAKNIQSMKLLSAATKNPQWAETAQTAQQQRIATKDFENKQDARNNYDAAVETYRATKDTNPAVAASAAAAADAYQQFTGDEPMTGAGGVQLNGRTKEPYIGSQAQRLSPETYTRMAQSLSEKVDVPAGDPSDPGKTIQVPLYKKMGFNSRAEAIAATVPAGTPDVPGQSPTPRGAVPAANTRPAPASAVTRPTVPRAPSAQPEAPVEKVAKAAGIPTSVLPAPVAVKAFSDPKFFPPKKASQPGTTFGKSTEINAEAESKRRAELQDVASDTSTNAGAALQYAQAAKAILDSKGAPITGPLGSLVKKVTAPFGSVDASNYEDLAKQLGNLAIQAGKGNFPNATQKEVGLQVEQLSPATTQTGPALRHLVDEAIRINQYAKNSATLATDYLDKGGVALRFGQWNEQYNPREAAVNQNTAPAAAIAHLKAHPELADAFKAKYGYVP